MTLDLLAESALRATMLGAAVWLPLRLSRLNDARTETGIWTMVMLAALAMPILTPVLPQRLVFSLAFLSPHGSLAATTGDATIAPPEHWLVAHGAAICWSLYGVGILVCLARLMLGLALTLRLYRRATPLTEKWARGRAIRASAAIESPISFANCILLPADYRGWSALKREAVLAHEEAHIARGDFFIQLLAMLHRALFWFSPFAWWLQFKLSELAETASDEAAVRRLRDRAAYAEILVEVSRRAHPGQALAAMAKGPGIRQRVERILSDAPRRSLGLPLRLCIIACLAPLALAAADTRAEIAPALVAARGLAPSVPQSSQVSAPALAAAKPVPRHRAVRRHLKTARTNTDAPSYDPRALLGDPQTAILPTIIPVSAAKTKSSTKVRPAGAVYLAEPDE